MKSLAIHSIVVLLAATFVGCAESKKPAEVTAGEEAHRADATAASETSGKAVYDDRCASCHKLGSYDASGDERDLAGRGKRISAAFVSRHTHSTITADELANLRAFIAAP